MRRAALAVVIAYAAFACSGVDADAGSDATLQVSGGRFVRAAMPNDQGGPAVSTVDVAVHTVPAGLHDKLLGGALTTGATAAAIGLAGDRGYWIVPAGAPDVNADNQPALSAKLSFARSAPPGDYDLVVRAIDAEGRFGAAKDTALTIVNAPIPTGHLVVTLAWDTEADLDLHVVMPDGTEIYNGDVNSWKPPPPGEPYEAGAPLSGGYLDFDSNAQCLIDGRRQEDVIFTTNAPSGHYVVRVDTFSMCGAPVARWSVDARIDGNVVASAGGTETGSGTRFDHGRGAGVLALELDVP